MAKPSGKGGGVYIQIAESGPVFALALSTFQTSHDPRLAEDTESDDLGASFSPSGAQLFSGILTLFRRDASYPEALSLAPGLRINRLWFKWGALLLGGTTPKGVMLFKPTLGTFSDDVQDIASNMPIQIQVMGGAIYRNVSMPTVGDTPDNDPISP